MISSAVFTRPLPGNSMHRHHRGQTGRGPPPGQPARNGQDRVGHINGRRWAELLATSGQLHGRHWAVSTGRRQSDSAELGGMAAGHGKVETDLKRLEANPPPALVHRPGAAPRANRWPADSGHLTALAMILDGAVSDRSPRL